MTNQSVLFILAFSALGGLIFGRWPIPGPYVPPGPVSMTFLFLFEFVCVGIVCALILAALWFVMPSGMLSQHQALAPAQVLSQADYDRLPIGAVLCQT